MNALLFVLKYIWSDDCFASFIEIAHTWNAKPLNVSELNNCYDYIIIIIINCLVIIIDYCEYKCSWLPFNYVKIKIINE